MLGECERSLIVLTGGRDVERVGNWDVGGYGMRAMLRIMRMLPGREVGADINRERRVSVSLKRGKRLPTSLRSDFC